MNIFVLAETPAEAARYHNDRHVAKMILESAQILSTAHVFLDGDAASKYRIGQPILRPTHVNHPCTLWARASSANYAWLAELMRSLCIEYSVRFDKHHVFAQSGLLNKLQLHSPLNLPRGELTPFAQCMPMQYTDINAVAAYRRYYFYEKRHIAEWKVRGKPHWWSMMESEQKNHPGRRVG